jgi:ATP-dependent Lhr-like helicase
VILVDGALAAYFARAAKQLQLFLPEDEPDRSRVARAVAERLRETAASADKASGLLIAEINGESAPGHAFGAQLREAGFLPSTQGFYLPRRRGFGSSTASQLTAADVLPELADGEEADDA